MGYGIWITTVNYLEVSKLVLGATAAVLIWYVAAGEKIRPEKW